MLYVPARLDTVQGQVLEVLERFGSVGKIRAQPQHFDLVALTATIAIISENFVC